MGTGNYSFLSKFKRHVSSSMVLIFFTVLAMICANIPVVKDWYSTLWLQPVEFSIGGFNFFSHGGDHMSLGEVINDFLMAIFFLSVGLEIKREIRVGELSTKDKALLPIIGACGGMIVPVLIFFLACPSGDVAQRGLAIPMATDIAFSLGVLSVFKTRVPVGLKIFLAALAVADDLGGIIVIALFYTSHIDMVFLALSALCVAALVIGNISKIRSKAYYVTIGLVLWYMMLNSGIHATIAGVIVAVVPDLLGLFLIESSVVLEADNVLGVNEIKLEILCENERVEILTAACRKIATRAVHHSALYVLKLSADIKIHAELLDVCRELGDPAHSVEQAVFSMQMQMREHILFILFSLPFFSSDLVTYTVSISYTAGRLLLLSHS